MSCYGDGGVFARRTISCASAPCSAPSSPKSRVKFLCSHGGKILPRPSDGQLKYVGGETRVISVPRDISFQELMKRLTYMIDGGMVLKYQLATEDLDALVTVKSEEDLVHMFDEMEHYQMMGLPRMRTFLFPIHNTVMDEQLPLDQRYIFSINGIITPSPSKKPHHLAVGSLASSTCTSPKSPDSYAAEANFSTAFANGNMHRIQSSPSISNLLNIAQQNNSNSHYSPHHQLPPQYYHTHSGYRSPNPPFRSGPRFQPDYSSPPPHSQSYYNYPSRDRGGNEYCSKCMHNDNCAHFSDRTSFDRLPTLP
ncbi:uncharacterized protein LOC131009010 [Salvia miltiorrhiza]|uniref:uncharacterized protein LOC131009010 n=1 Tax=Salvia miltiorrhiza TaxID=226208 RepID=UPI0025ACFA81|nr:uncharacterized protein LOC131009010 [Salvia miltiorrhiza]